MVEGLTSIEARHESRCRSSLFSAEVRKDHRRGVEQW